MSYYDIMENENKSVIVGILSGFGVLMALGIPTALIPSGIYIRMIEVTIFDYFFLLATSMLIGIYIGLWSYKKESGHYGKKYLIGGSASSFFAVSCPLCNILLVSLIGVSSVMIFIEPLRPVLGVTGLLVLGYLIYVKYNGFGKRVKK